MLPTRSLLLLLVLCPLILAITPESSSARKLGQGEQTLAIRDSESASLESKHGNKSAVSKKQAKHSRHDDDGDDDDDRVRPPKARLKVKDLTRDRHALNWIKLDAQKSKGRNTRIVEYVFAVTLAGTGQKIHSPGASESPIAHIHLPPGRYVASVKVKDARGKSRIRSRRFRVRGGPVAGFDPTRVEWGLGQRWKLGDPATTIAIPGGPLDYQSLAEIFSQEPTGADLTSSALKASGGCGSTMSGVSNGLKIASGVFSFVPGAGSVLGTTGQIVGMSGSKDASACTQGEIDVINNQLAYQETQIENIEKYMALASGVFYEDVVRLATGDLKSDMNTYDNALALISSCEQGSGIAKFMLAAEMWPQGCDTPAANFEVDVPTLAGNATIFQAVKGAGPTGLTENIRQVTSTQVTGNCTDDCYQHVIALPVSALTNLYDALWTEGQVTSFNPPMQNLIPLYDSYNNYLAAYYQKSLNALQQGFVMEWYVNQYNFYAAGCPGGEAQCISTQTGVCEGTTGPLNENDYLAATTRCFHGGGQILAIGGVSGTNYPPQNPTDISTPETAIAAYNDAQQQLLLLYAARVNQLYLNTLNYTVSDRPVAPQAYPLAQTHADGPPEIFGVGAWPQTIQFEEELGLSITPRTPLLQVQKKVNANAGTSGVDQGLSEDAYICGVSDFDDCTCYGNVVYGKKFIDSLDDKGAEMPGSGELTSFAQMTSEDTYALLDGSLGRQGASGTINCSPDTFGIDPAPDFYKHCYCEPATDTAWDMVLYQAPMQNPYKCISSLNAYNAEQESMGVQGKLSVAFADPSDCPPIFSLSDGSPLNGGFYDGHTLQPYSYSVSPGGSDACPNTCSICSAGNFEYTCASDGSTCEPNLSSACNNAPGTCLASQTGALNLVYDIPDTWDTPARSVGNGSWSESCDLTTAIFSGVPNSLGTPPQLCASCPPPSGSHISSCEICPSAQWTNTDGLLTCAEGPEVCRGFCADNSCGDSDYAVANSPKYPKEPTGLACAAPHGAVEGDAVCCGQTGTLGSTADACPAEYPVCVGFIQDVTFGTCQGVSNQPNEETFTDCTECGGEPVLGLSAYLLGNIGLCANEGGSQMAWYRPPVSYSGNAAGLRGRLPYLSCANWKTPETFSEAGKAIDNSVNTPISSDGNYQADQVMLGPQCQDDYQLSTGAIFGAWATTDWSCGDSAPGTGASTAIAGTDGSCGTIGFNRIKNGESNSTVYESYLNMTRVNAATGLSDGGMEIPMSLVYQCSEFCTGPGGTSEDDHNKCMNVVALEKATIENDGYTCVETSAAKNALSCTLIDGQQFSVNLTVVASGPGEFDALWGSLEVGQANIQCPSACSQCESGLGGETPGGQSLVDGYCTGFCSGYGFCGGSDYNVPDGPQAPIDCRQCVY